MTDAPGRTGRVTWQTLCLFVIAALIPTGAFAADDRPNVIVILADDLGYADVGEYGIAAEVRTPNLDRLARQGVLCTAGYVTAPQCSPSRAGLLTGRYQQRFGLDSIPDCPMPLEEVTLAERLQGAGYACGMVGKWHLEPTALSRRWAQAALPELRPNRQGRLAIPFDRAREFYPDRQGFADYFVGAAKRYYANDSIKVRGAASEGSWREDARFRVDVQTEAALAFLKQDRDTPFFLYIGYFAPHVPLEATQPYLDRFPETLPVRRRYALAMTAAIDDGVGRILDALEEKGVARRSLILFTSDNGAPLQGKEDLPIDVSGATWDGSLNDPWIGEKGMLAEGGIRVPFLLRWPDRLPSGKVYERPVSTLDIAATAVAAAGLPQDPLLDGVDLAPILNGTQEGDPHEVLFWRFWGQAAVRAGRWKYLRAGDRAEYLFDLESVEHEKKNLIIEQPERAGELRDRLQGWTNELQPPGLPDALNAQEIGWYRRYFALPDAPAVNPKPPRKNSLGAS